LLLVVGCCFRFSILLDGVPFPADAWMWAYNNAAASTLSDDKLCVRFDQSMRL
jgi:hypothetical protein